MDIRLVSFDLDGTIFPNTTTCIELGKRLGHLSVIERLEAQYKNFEITNRQVAEGDAFAYAGQAVKDVESVILQIPTIQGFIETIGALKQRGILCLIVTVTWSFAARALANRYNMDGYAGAQMIEENGILAGRVLQHFEAEDKVRFVEGFARQHGIPLAQCAAIGDSRSDIPLFGSVGCAIALNATSEARAAASRALDTHDMRDVLPLLV
jgi:phosphoserine phosphatase